MHWVTEFCNRAILIEAGRVVADGEPAEIVRIHQEHSEQTRARKARETAAMLAGSAASVGGSSAGGTPGLGRRTDR